jgi:hypothetical protein
VAIFDAKCPSPPAPYEQSFSVIMTRRGMTADLRCSLGSQHFLDHAKAEGNRKKSQQS